MNRFEDKTALVTGGGSGIGRSVCLRLASEGAHVLVVDLNSDSAQQTVTDIAASNGSATAYNCDIANHAQTTDVLQGIIAEQPIDILVNNAGIAHVGNIENTSEKDLNQLYQVNIKGVYNVLSVVVPAMKKRRNGAIVNLASIASSVGLADRFAYAMTKGAVLTMTLSVAKDYIHQGIRCNCVSPARVHTPFVDKFLAKNYPDNQEEMFETLSKSQPIGRMAKAEEVAGLIAYLASDEAAFITGSNFPIDGGFITLNN